MTFKSNRTRSISASLPFCAKIRRHRPRDLADEATQGCLHEAQEIAPYFPTGGGGGGGGGGGAQDCPYVRFFSGKTWKAVANLTNMGGMDRRSELSQI